jgi:hypothetical protein
VTLMIRDPYSRTELHRETVPATKDGCAWCGAMRNGRLYEFSTQHDGGRVAKHDHQFCSVKCFRSFNS